MIIHGSTSINSTIGSGTFHCPRCNLPRPYTHIGVDRYWTLYFIPLIPLGRRGDYVECQQCSGTYGAEVLNYQPDPEAQQRMAEATATKLWNDLRRILVLVVHHAQRVDRHALEQLKSWYESQSKQSLQPEVLAQEFRQAAEANPPLEPFARQLFGGAALDARQFVMQAARHQLQRDGRLTDQDKDVLRRLGQGLGFAPVDIEQAISS